MKAVFFSFLILAIFFQNVYSQPCGLTNQMSISTGFNPSTNLTIGIGSPDPRWIIDNANNIPGALNNSPAIACTPSGGNASNPNSAWLGYATTSAYVTNNPNIGYYLITFRLPFRTCQADSLFFNMNIANDNYISEIRVDGIPTGFSQPVSLLAANYMTFTPHSYSGIYSAGNHTLEVDVQNYNVNNAMNPHMLNIWGTLNSNSNSIVSFANPQNCTCNVNPVDSVVADFFSLNPNICDSTIIQFTDLSIAYNSTVTSWLWDFGDGNFSNLQNPINNYVVPGNYIVTLIATNNFSSSDTFSTNVYVGGVQAPNVSALATPGVLCLGDSTVLSGAGGATYTWSGNVQDGVPFSPAATTTYTVTGVNANGCSNTSTVIVIVNPLPNVVASANMQTVCEGSPVVLNGIGALTYNWSGNIVNGVSFYPNVSTTYTVTGTDVNGCTNIDSILITISDGLNIVVLPSEPFICLGDSIELVATGAMTYSWQQNPGLNVYSGPTVWASPSSTSTFIVTGSDASGCSGTASVTVNVIEEVELDVTKSRDVECGTNQVQLHASGAQEYVWSPASNLSNPSAASTNATVSSTTVFYVTGSIGSCTATDSIVVYVFNNDQDGIYIPTAFTPNSDGINDCFRIRHNARFEKYLFVIYNRWGQRIFESDNPSDCWNGEYNNEKMPLETYFYYLKAQTLCGSVIRKGDFLLIR